MNVSNKCNLVTMCVCVLLLCRSPLNETFHVQYGRNEHKDEIPFEFLKAKQVMECNDIYCVLL